MNSGSGGKRFACSPFSGVFVLPGHMRKGSLTEIFQTVNELSLAFQYEPLGTILFATLKSPLVGAFLFCQNRVIFNRSCKKGCEGKEKALYCKKDSFKEAAL